MLFFFTILRVLNYDSEMTVMKLVCFRNVLISVSLSPLVSSVVDLFFIYFSSVMHGKSIFEKVADINVEKAKC